MTIMNTHYISDSFTSAFAITVAGLLDDCYTDLSSRFGTTNLRRLGTWVGVEGRSAPELGFGIEQRGDYYVPAIYLRQAWVACAGDVALDDTLFQIEADRSAANANAVELAGIWLNKYSGLSWLIDDVRDAVKVAEAQARLAAQRELSEAQAQANTEGKMTVLRNILDGKKLSAYEGTVARNMKLLTVTEGKVRRLTALGYRVLGMEPPVEPPAAADQIPETIPDAPAGDEPAADPAPASEPPAAEQTTAPEQSSEAEQSPAQEPTIEPEPGETKPAPRKRDRTNERGRGQRGNRPAAA